jgi:hypothetical protein
MGLFSTIPFKAGEWVEVLEWEAIEKTLDADGTCDGLPFMPEMLEYIGRRFRVLRYAEKTCLESSDGRFLNRAFLKKDILHLDGLRCSGADHDGCQRLCLLFWKAAWLRKVRVEQSAVVMNLPSLDKVRSNLKTRETSTKYFCQATQLEKITRDATREDTISQCFKDLWSGAIGILEMISLILVPLGRRIRNRVFGRPRLLGTLKRTPVEHLALQPGDLVEVKSLKEMQGTLDALGRNRGLVCDIELNRYCGKRYRVLTRLDRIITERTAEMRSVEATVMLEGIPCLCAWTLGGCPRSDFAYFREIWLKKVGPGPERSGERVSPNRLE